MGKSDIANAYNHASEKEKTAMLQDLRGGIKELFSSKKNLGIKKMPDKVKPKGILQPAEMRELRKKIKTLLSARANVDSESSWLFLKHIQNLPFGRKFATVAEARRVEDLYMEYLYWQKRLAKKLLSRPKNTEEQT